MIRGYNLKGLTHFFNSLTAALELVYTCEGIKPCCRMIINYKRKGYLQDFCRNNGLHIEFADYKIIPSESTNQKGFSNMCRRGPLDKEEGNTYVYISKDADTAKKAKLFQKRGNDLEFGRLLGYPECCVQFFERFKKKAEGRNMDFTLFGLDRLESFPFYNNYALRCFDVSLIHHFPCSPDCAKSRHLAKNNMAFLKAKFPNIADFFERNLKSCVLYTLDKGVFCFSDYMWKEDKIFFSSVTSSTKNNLHYGLFEKKRFTVESYDKITIGKDVLEGDDIGLFIFV